MATNIENMVVTEVSLVDKGANPHADVILYKREGDDLPGEVEDYLKREFTAEDRKKLAGSGDAMPDGSYPIANTSDLHNAIQAIGRAKNPAAAKRHIILRARALGASGDLPDDWKVSKTASDIEKAAWAFRDAAADIMGDDLEKVAALDEYADEFRKQFAPITNPQGDSLMTTEIEQTLAKSVSDLEAVRSDLSKAQTTVADFEIIKGLAPAHRDFAIAKGLTGDVLKAFGKKPDADKDAEVSDDKAKMEKAAMDALPEAIRKQLEAGAAASERLAKAEAAAELVVLNKRAVEHGLPESAGETIQKAYAGDKESIDKLLVFVKAAAAQAATGELFKSFGSGSGNGTGASAYDRIVAAGEAIRKSDPKFANFTKEQLNAIVLKSNTPEHVELRKAYASERAV